MQIVIVSVGKSPESTVRGLIDDYEKRLSRDYQIKWRYLSASASSEKLVCQNEESERILKILTTNDKVILLDERGEQKDNESFANTFEKLASAHGRLIFIIGGAYGVNNNVRQQADFIWSLSTLVFPHRLIRLILIEQIYRTAMVIKGHPYHHS